MQKNKLPHPLGNLAGTKKFATTSRTPSLFNVEEAWILTQVKQFFGILAHYLFGLLAIIPHPNTLCLNLLACHWQEVQVWTC